MNSESEVLTVEVCSACGAMAGQSAHGHRDGRPWEWRQVEYVPLAEVEQLRKQLDKPLRETILAVLQTMPADAAPEHLAAIIESQVRAWQAVPPADE